MKKILLLLTLVLAPLRVRAEGCSSQYGCVARTTGVTVTTSATLLTTPALTGQDTLCIWNNGGSTLYWGFAATLTIANGIPLVPGSMPICLGYGSGVPIYGIVATGTLDVRILQQGGHGTPSGGVK